MLTWMAVYYKIFVVFDQTVILFNCWGFGFFYGNHFYWHSRNFYWRFVANEVKLHSTLSYNRQVQCRSQRSCIIVLFSERKSWLMGTKMAAIQRVAIEERGHFCLVSIPWLASERVDWTKSDRNFADFPTQAGEFPCNYNFQSITIYLIKFE